MKTLIVDQDVHAIQLIKYHIGNCCLGVTNCFSASCLQDAEQIFEEESPEIAFINIDEATNVELLELLADKQEGTCELIITSSIPTVATVAIQRTFTSFIPKPIQSADLVHVIATVQNRILQNQKIEQNRNLLVNLQKPQEQDELFAIPTLDGYEILCPCDIIRFEGLQKCTRVVTIKRSDIISSYNLGEFKKMVAKHRFVLTHKSHLINLSHIKRLNHEGTITMCDDSYVPLSRRKRQGFLKNLNFPKCTRYSKSTTAK